MTTPSKRDWKLYQEKIKEWQEHYMEKLVKEYAGLIRRNVITIEDLVEFSDELKEEATLILQRSIYCSRC